MSTDALPLPALDELPVDSATLRQLVLQLLEALRGERDQREKLQHHLDLLLRRLYGRTSEKLDPLQQLLFGIAAEESPSAITETPLAEEPEAAAKQRHGHGRRPKPDHLKRVDVIHDLSDTEKQVLAGDGELILIGEEVTEQYDWKPSSLYLVRHIQKKYVRRPALLESGPEPNEKNVITAAKPPAPIPGGIAGPGLIAHSLVSRFLEHMPFHRQERHYGRNGFSFSRQTTDGWALDVAERWFAPLIDLTIAEILLGSYLGTDDTPVKVRDAHGQRQYQGRFWEYYSHEQPLTVFRYTPDHSRDGPGGPAEFLKNFSGFVQADAFSGYDAIYRGSHGRIIEVACWAHARRKFIEARTADRARGETALAHIGRLYAVEKELRARFDREWKELPCEERWPLIAQERQARSRPVLDEFAAWMEREISGEKVLPKNPIRAAMEYARNNWPALLRYSEHGRLRIDNNLVEGSLRGIALGRKNWLFLGSDRGGRAAAIHFSLIASCLRNQVEPFAYLRDLLTRLPALLPAASRQTLRSLLPDRWSPGP